MTKAPRASAALLAAAERALAADENLRARVNRQRTLLLDWLRQVDAPVWPRCRQIVARTRDELQEPFA